MRVVAGTWGGRRLTAPAGSATRPTSDRVREGLFSSLKSRYPSALDASSVLDAFAGSGALALEALSRGAGRATAVERDRRALACLRHNVESLDAGNCMVVSGDVLRLARAGRIPGGPFALLLLDPPYRIERAQVRALLEDLVRTGALSSGCVVAYEHATSECVDWPKGFEPESERSYGDTTVSIGVYARGG